mgnify:FL=1
MEDERPEIVTRLSPELVLEIDRMIASGIAKSLDDALMQMVTAVVHSADVEAALREWRFHGNAEPLRAIFGRPIIDLLEAL